MKEKELKQIIEHFGISNQIKKLDEEVTELTIECIKNSYTDSYFAIQEEMADVYVVLKQIQLYFDISDEELEEVEKEKIDRTLKRIKEGYYDKDR